MMETSHHVHVGEHVRLKTNVPASGLQSGESGLVCSSWFSPAPVFEVEFEQSGLIYPVRALLFEDQIEADEHLCSEATR